MRKNPTFKHPAIEGLANAMFYASDRRHLVCCGTPIPIQKEYLQQWREILADKEKELQGLRTVLAFSEMAALICPDGVEVDYHDEEDQ